MHHKDDVNFGNILTIIIGAVAMLAAYWAFVTSTNESIAKHQTRLDQHDEQIAEIKAVLPDIQAALTTLTTQQTYAIESVRKVEADVDWLVKREIDNEDKK